MATACDNLRPVQRRYKVVHLESGTEIRKGFAANSLKHLIQVACREFMVQNVNDAKLVLAEDSTEVDDDDYFALLPADTVFILRSSAKTSSPKTEESFRFWKVAGDLVRKVWRLPAAVSGASNDDLMKVIEALAANETIRRRIQEVLDRTTVNLDDSKTNDAAWFQDLKTNVASKEAWMTKNSKERVRGYYIKSKDDVENALFGGRSGVRRNRSTIQSESIGSGQMRAVFDTVFESMRTKLNERNFYAGYFGRSDRGLRLCDANGWFPCQGEYDRMKCAYAHRINPYGNRESRIMFSTWNLDHVVERSRSIVPALAEAIRQAGSKSDVNWNYFHRLLFVARRGNRDNGDEEDRNLKLVHTVCHVKAAHKHYSCDKRKYF